MAIVGHSEEEQMMSEMLLDEAVQKLPPKQRVVVALRAAGYTQQECGVILGLTRAAIGFIHKQALAKIRQSLLEGQG
jgi:RNA polymerase sigma factor (sigma-70 family)